jgi:PncC family amidohydrolase
MGKVAWMSPEEKLNAILMLNGRTIALAESCTGGLISSRITDVAGASNYFQAGVVSYGNKAKESFLGVPGEILATKGSVSAETAQEMAEGIRRAASADVGLSVTGIAGPGGGSAEKPVGTVYMALAAEEKTVVRKHLFSGDRRAIREQTAHEALLLLIEYFETGVAG